MTREKQIDEMAKDLCHKTTCAIKKDGDDCYKYCNAYIYAFRAINAGYRKQSEWISVDERLPDRDGRYLVAMKNGNDYHISTRKFKRASPPIWWKGHTYGHWVRQTGGVRYWMPLPEAPKMKGGAEQ